MEFRRCPVCGTSDGEHLDFKKPDVVLKDDFQSVTVTGFCDNCGATIILHYTLKRVESEKP